MHSKILKFVFKLTRLWKYLLISTELKKRDFCARAIVYLLKFVTSAKFFFLIILNEFLQFDREEYQVHQYAGIHPY